MIQMPTLYLRVTSKQLPRYAVLSHLFPLAHTSLLQEDMLEEFYLKLGSQPLSGLIKEEYRSSGTPTVTVSATSLRQLVLERLTLFYSDRTRTNADVSLDWLKKDKNFTVFQVGSINLKRTLKQGGLERTNLQAVSASVLKGRAGIISLYISTGVELDMFE